MMLVPDGDSATVISLGGTWGDHAEWVIPGEKLVGHRTPRPRAGDLVRSPMQSGRDALYRMVTVRPCFDPSDMYFADVKWTGYVDG